MCIKVICGLTVTSRRVCGCGGGCKNPNRGFQVEIQTALKILDFF